MVPESPLPVFFIRIPESVWIGISTSIGTTIPVGGLEGQMYELEDFDCLNKNERRIARGKTSIDATVPVTTSDASNQKE